jgi:two-component system response regulator
LSTVQHGVDILLVEDSEADAALVMHVLDACQPSASVHVVRDGSEALEFVFCTGQYANRNPEQRPCVVLLDLNLPKVSGIEVLQRVKSDPRTLTIPIVILSSSQSPGDLSRCYRLGANSYLVKETDFAAFSETLRVAQVYWTRINRPAPDA